VLVRQLTTTAGVLATDGTVGGPFDDIAIPTDFSIGPVTEGSPSGPVAYVKATWSQPDTPYFERMLYAVSVKVTGAGSYTAPESLVVGTRNGSDKIPADPGTTVSVTPITENFGGHRFRGAAAFEVDVPAAGAPLCTVGTPVAGPASIQIPITQDPTCSRTEVWYTDFVSDPGTPVSQFHVGTLFTYLYPNEFSGSVVIPIGGSSHYLVATFVDFNQYGLPTLPPQTIKVQGAAGSAPSAPTAASNTSVTSSSVTNSVTMPGSITNFDFIRVYKNGVLYGSDITRTAGAGSPQSVVHSGLSSGEVASWQYSGVSSGGAESSKTTSFTTTCSVATIPTPTVGTISYDTVTDKFDVQVVPGGSTPSGVTWHVKLGLVNPPTTEDTTVKSTSTHLFPYWAQTSSTQTVYFKVFGTKTGYTQSADSAVKSATVPAQGSHN